MIDRYDNLASMKRSQFVAIVIILLAAFGLRVHAIAAQPLSGDEAFTVTQWGPATIAELLNYIAKIDPQPPVALLTYRTWIELAGNTETGVRLISVFFSVITIAAAFRLTKFILPRQAAYLAAVLCAIAPFQIWYAQDARHYAEWMCFSLIATTALIRALPTKRLTPWLIYVLFASLSLQTFYLELFVFAASGLFALMYFIRRNGVNSAWVFSQVTIAATYIPWLIYSRPQNSTYQPTASFPNVPASINELVFNNTLPSFLTTGFLQGSEVTALQVIMIGALIISTGLLVYARRPIWKYLIIFQAALPIGLLAALSLITQKAFFRTRYIAAASVPILILLSAIPFLFPLQKRSRTIGYLFALAIVPVCFTAYAEYRHNPQFAKAPPWREIAAVLQHNTAPNDLVIQNYPDPAFDYYYRGPAPTITLPSTENPPASTTIAQLKDLPSRYDHLWFIRVDTPFWDRQEVVANWLQNNTEYLSDSWVAEMRLYQYGGWSTPRQNIRNPLNIDMGLAILRGYRLSATPPYPAHPDHLTVELFWQPTMHSTDDLHIFVHLISNNPDGSIKLWGQDDHPPQSGRLSTSTWPTAGSIYRDVYHITLPDNSTTLSYHLTVGFYNPVTLQRLPIPTSTSQPEPNSALITDLTLPIPK